MVRKQGGLITGIQANENVVEKCLAEVRRVEPDSLADKLFHITIKADAYKKFTMNGFTYTTDGNGNFASIAKAGWLPERYRVMTKQLQNLTLRPCAPWA